MSLQCTNAPLCSYAPETVPVAAAAPTAKIDTGDTTWIFGLPCPSANSPIKSLAYSACLQSSACPICLSSPQTSDTL